MGVKERLIEFIETKNLSTSKFESMCGLSNGFVNNIGYSITKKSVEKISKAFPDIDINYILLGIPTGKKAEAIPVEDTRIMMVPLVHQFAYAGYLSGYADEEYIESLPKIPFFVDHNGKGHYLSFEVKGDSMFDGSFNSYLDRDRVLAREISPDYWRSKLHINKWNFVIVHKTEGILIKKIIRHDIEKGEITIHSLNPEYEDQVLNLNDVAKLFNVIKFERGER